MLPQQQRKYRAIEQGNVPILKLSYICIFISEGDLIVRLGSITEVRLDGTESREQFLCLPVGDRGVDDDVLGGLC
jgi:hypothetical protein